MIHGVEGYYTPSSPLFYTFFNPTSDSMECKLSYHYSYIRNDVCYLGSDQPTGKINPKSALTVPFAFVSRNEEDDKIQSQYVITLCILGV